MVDMGILLYEPTSPSNKYIVTFWYMCSENSIDKTELDILCRIVRGFHRIFAMDVTC